MNSLSLSPRGEKRKKEEQATWVRPIRSLSDTRTQKCVVKDEEEQKKVQDGEGREGG